MRKVFRTGVFELSGITGIFVIFSPIRDKREMTVYSRYNKRDDGN